MGAVVRPSLREGWRERLGLVEAPLPGAVWVHGASVGEVQAGLSLIAALEASGERVVASAMTTTGRALLRRRRPDLPSALAPVDHPWCTAAALRRVAPAALVFVETELWPAWLLAARDAKVPVVFLSARLSDRSFPRYRRAARLLRPLLAAVAGVGARSERDAERFVALGVAKDRVEVTGDLKLEPPPAAPALAGELAASVGDLPVFLAGSTHPGEDEAALSALAAAEAAGRAALLVLAPRHPERFDAAVAAAKRAGRRVLRRTQLAGTGEPALAAGDVLVLDSLGELGALWARADVAFVGGSLVPRGGHNLAEPARAGCAVLFGPHTENTRESAELLLAADAARRVADAEELAQAVVAALGDPEGWRERGARAARSLADHAGATRRSVALLRRARERGAA